MLASLGSRVGGGSANSPAPRNQPFDGKCRIIQVNFDFRLGGKMRPAGGAKARWSPVRWAAESRTIRSCRTNANPKDGR